MKKIRKRIRKSISFTQKVIAIPFNKVKSADRQKIFCIGLHKTGTSSLTSAIKELGFIVGNQQDGEALIKDWDKRNFTKIIKLCSTGEFFQDGVFFFPYTFIILDYHFPGSKFILSLRDDAEEWYKSLTSFIMKLCNTGNRLPTIDELKAETNRCVYKGILWDYLNYVYHTDEKDPLNKDILIQHYNMHIKDVKNYFNSQPEKLLIINVKERDSYKRLCQFLDKTPIRETFEWKNKTSEII